VNLLILLFSTGRDAAYAGNTNDIIMIIAKIAASVFLFISLPSGFYFFIAVTFVAVIVTSIIVIAVTAIVVIAFAAVTAIIFTLYLLDTKRLTPFHRVKH
jgi:hypothetical protein